MIIPYSRLAEGGCTLPLQGGVPAGGGGKKETDDYFDYFYPYRTFVAMPDNNHQYPYNHKEQTPLRKELRNKGTSAEATLWLSLKGRQIEGMRWRRQFGVGPFILDFYCPQLHLCIELDGAQHYTIQGAENDQHARNGYGTRTAYVPYALKIKMYSFTTKL